MKEFAFIFRNVIDPAIQPSADQIKEVATSWMNWMGSIAAQNKLANPGNRLSTSQAKTLKSNNVITDGPYAEVKEFISGYFIVKTDNIEEAIELAKGCPIFKVGGNVEIRAIVTPNDNS